MIDGNFAIHANVQTWISQDSTPYYDYLCGTLWVKVCRPTGGPFLWSATFGQGIGLALYRHFNKWDRFDTFKNCWRTEEESFMNFDRDCYPMDLGQTNPKKASNANIFFNKRNIAKEFCGKKHPMGKIKAWMDNISSLLLWLNTSMLCGRFSTISCSLS